MILRLTLVLLLGCGGASETDPAGFFSSSDPVGLAAVDLGSLCLTSEDDCQPELSAGALAIGDVDRDGRYDVVLTRIGEHDRLFLARDGSFVDASAEWGLDSVAAHSNGAALVDVDRDGDLDLYVLGLGPPESAPPHDRYHFWRNEGDHFVEDALVRGLAFASDASHAGMSIAVGDYDRDGWPDLHLTEWRASVGVARPTHERLLHNLGPDRPGHFEDVTVESGVFLAGPQCAMDGTACVAKSFASAFTDLDADGHIDLAVVADFGRSRLFWGRGDGTFIDGTEAAGVGTDENGMGSTIADVDGDGLLDWFVTSISDDESRCAFESCGWGLSGNRLYRGLGGRAFDDGTDSFGLRDGGWGWGAAFFDMDNDGDLDLTMTNGWSESSTDADLPFEREPMRLWMQERSGAFREIAAEAGLDERAQGRGLCVEDIDADGDLDVLVAEHGGGLRLLRNERGNERHWLRVRATHADGTIAYGARLELGAQVREVATAAHFLCSTEPVVHFGLGASRSTASVRAHWPDGVTTEHELAADREHTIVH